MLWRSLFGSNVTTLGPTARSLLLQDRAALVADVRKTRNKGVQRAHERLYRDLAKQQEDDRERRLEALRANDFEAYQELLIQQQVGLNHSVPQR